MISSWSWCPLPNSFGLWAEFIFLQLSDRGPHFPAGCPLGITLSCLRLLSGYSDMALSEYDSLVPHSQLEDVRHLGSHLGLICYVSSQGGDIPPWPQGPSIPTPKGRGLYRAHTPGVGNVIVILQSCLSPQFSLLLAF